MKIRLEKPSARREEDFLHAASRSRRLHSGRVTPPRSSEDFRDYLRRLRQRSCEGRWVVLSDSAEIVGVVNLNEIVRHSFQSAYLGYYTFSPHARRGYMRAGLALMIRYAFNDLRLHRLEANIQPGNRASIELVKGLEFRLEGLSRRYLKVSGRWRDHERWALLAEDWRGRG